MLTVTVTVKQIATAAVYPHTHTQTHTHTRYHIQNEYDISSFFLCGLDQGRYEKSSSVSIILSSE